MRVCFHLASASVIVALMATSASADLLFSTGDPDGQIATASRPEAPGKIEIESADDFAIAAPTRVDSATFTGILTGGATPADIDHLVVELYRIFPADSNTARTPVVPTRMNSPSDVAFDSRDSAAGTLSFTTTPLNGGNPFTAANSVLNGIHTSAPFNTGGEGAQTGTEVRFNVTFSSPFSLAPGEHDFFVPQVGVSGSGEFLWLSAPRPIVAPGTPFPSGITDLQSWIRNANLDPDWLRIGTDIVDGTTPPTFNGTFSLSGQAVPEPQSLALLAVGIVGVLGVSSYRRRQAA